MELEIKDERDGLKNFKFKSVRSICGLEDRYVSFYCGRSFHCRTLKFGGMKVKALSKTLNLFQNFRQIS